MQQKLHADIIGKVEIAMGAGASRQAIPEDRLGSENSLGQHAMGQSDCFSRAADAVGRDDPTNIIRTCAVEVLILQRLAVAAQPFLIGAEWVTLEQFAALPRGGRKYFLKYAGADVARNWGSRAVFRLDTHSREKCLMRLRAVTERYRRGERWIVQQACSSNEEISFLTREGEIATMSANSKYSVFYGPERALGMKSVFEGHYKVHVSTESVMRIDLLSEDQPALT
ncbi:MAG: hypothetical protein WD871_13225 [Xanthobacteraceae bacterium]